MDVVANTIKRYEETAEDYTNKWSDPAAVQPDLERFIAFLGNPPQRILDVGCGPGRDAGS